MKRRKGIVLAFSMFIIFSCNAQFESGFKPSEAKDMIQLCNSFSYMDLYNNDKAIIPLAYEKIYTSTSTKMTINFRFINMGMKR